MSAAGPFDLGKHLFGMGLALNRAQLAEVKPVSPIETRREPDLSVLTSTQLAEMAVDHADIVVRRKAALALYQSGLKEGVTMANAAHAHITDKAIAAERARGVR